MRKFRELPAAQAGLIRDLLQRKRARDAEGAFVIEGVKPVQDLLMDRNAALRSVIVTSPFLEDCAPTMKRALGACADLVYVCRSRVFDKLADVMTPAGILAVVSKPEWDIEGLLRKRRMLALYGECIQDPANVGAIIRTAAAFGMDAVCLSRDSADVYNPKVVRASAGTVLRTPVCLIADPTIFVEHQCEIVAAMPPGGPSRPIQEVTALAPRAVLAFGNESRGLSNPTVKHAAVQFHIPMKREVESLNVAASVAIAAFYFSNLKRGVRGQQSRVSGQG